MGAEIGATSSLFPFNSRQVDYLNATKRPQVADYAQRFSHNLKADQNAEYDRVININLNELEPHINGRTLFISSVLIAADSPRSFHT